VQVPLLRELGHVLDHTYVKRTDVEDFLGGLLSTEKLTGEDPTAFWRGTSFLDIQSAGSSQRELLELLDGVLSDQLGLSLNECESDDSFVYIDDAIFSGFRMSSDLSTWVGASAPQTARLDVITIADHAGSYY